MAARVAGGAARWRRLPSVHVWRWMRILAGIALLAIALLSGALRVPLGYLIGHQHRLAEVAVPGALFEGVLLLVVLLLSVDRERPRAQDRFPFLAELIARPFTLTARARPSELSLAGATLTLDGAPPLSEDRAVRIELDELGAAHGQIQWVGETRAGVQWTWLDDALVGRLTERFPELLAPRRDQSRRHPRIECDLPVRVHTLGRGTTAWRTRNVSLSGAMLGEPDDLDTPLGTHLSLEFPAIGSIDALVVRRSAAGTAVRFTGMEERTREQLIRHLYTMGLEQGRDPAPGLARRLTTILGRLVGAG